MANQEKMSPVTPYLTVRGAVDAIAFYTKAFGATENARMPAPDGKRLIHADITINGGRVLMSDEFPEHSDECGGAADAERPVRPSLDVECAAAGKEGVDAPRAGSRA